MMHTPSELKIEKGTVIGLKNGWKENTYYVVKVAFSGNNIIHKALFYCGFLRNNKPGNFSKITKAGYGNDYHIDDAYYIEAVEEIEINLKMY
jgi:hypothetical protein